MPYLREAQLRHAQYYLAALIVAERLYHQGSESVNRSLALFDADWANIEVGQ